MKLRNFSMIIFSLIILTGCSKFQELKKNLTLSYSSEENDTQKEEYVSSKYRKNFRNNHIASIDNQIFLQQHGKIGLWVPYKFIDEIGGGIYLLERYESTKIPILFVHGAGGNAIEWAEIIENINRNIYQPIVVSYPSGMQLNLTANIMNEKLQQMIQKYNINEIIIIAHSMGGLVSKSLIKKLNEDIDIVKTFITLSTPWEGHDGASNTKDLPYYIPSWADMQPNSKFIKALRNETTLQKINHYLLFGYKGSMTLYGRDNDGTISLRSQLGDYAQNNATKIFGFNESHTSILKSKKVIKKINVILKPKF